MFPGIRCPYCSSEDVCYKKIEEDDRLDENYFDVDMVCYTCKQSWNDFYEIHLCGRGFDPNKGMSDELKRMIEETEKAKKCIHYASGSWCKFFTKKRKVYSHCYKVLPFSDGIANSCPEYKERR